MQVTENTNQRWGAVAQWLERFFADYASQDLPHEESE